MAARDPKLATAAAADSRVQAALEHVEAAQRELERACQELSPIIGGAATWKRVAVLCDRVKAEWYRIDVWARKQQGKLSLDGLGRRDLEKEGTP